MKTRHRETLPNCDICKATELSVVYDMPFLGGHWANCCEKCRLQCETPNHPAGIRFVKGEHPKAKALKHSNGSRSITEIENDHANALNPGELDDMSFDSVVEAADGCSVEPDGTCPHGYRSPLLVLGLV